MAGYLANRNRISGTSLEFIQLKCIINLGTWTQQCHYDFFTTTMVCYSILWGLEFYYFIVVPGHSVVPGNYTLFILPQ